MPHHPETPDVLRRQGFRITPQRLLILDILQHSDRHLSVEELYAQVQARFASTDISTVYRTLEMLTSLGLLQKVSLGEAHDHYEWVEEEPHYHIVCQHCGAVMPFGDEMLEQMKALLEQKHHFRVERAFVEVFGTCPRCVGAGSGGEQLPSHQH